MKRELIGKVASAIGYAIMTAIAIWLLVSWADVIAHNCTDCCYAWWNIFTIVF